MSWKKRVETIHSKAAIIFFNDGSVPVANELLPRITDEAWVSWALVQKSRGDKLLATFFWRSSIWTHLKASISSVTSSCDRYSGIANTASATVNYRRGWQGVVWISITPRFIAGFSVIRLKWKSDYAGSGIPFRSLSVAYWWNVHECQEPLGFSVPGRRQQGPHCWFLSFPAS